MYDSFWRFGIMCGIVEFYLTFNEINNHSQVKYLWLLFDLAVGPDNLVESGPYK